MINSFADPETEKVWHFQPSRKLPPDIQDTARRKLGWLHRAAQLHDLRVPGGNRLEQLKGYDPLRYSIRVNDQWRITFNWSDGDASNVRIEDYH
jgi:proteic killer suppression protein